MDANSDLEIRTQKRNLLMKYFIGADHAGIDIKAYVKELFEARGHEVVDLGPNDKR